MERWLVWLFVIFAACDAGEPDFALVAPDQTVVLVPGQVGEVEVEVERFGGFDRTVIVTANQLRAGITPGVLSLRPGDTSGVLQLAVETSAVEGPIEDAVLIGMSGELERTVPLLLEVSSR